MRFALHLRRFVNDWVRGFTVAGLPIRVSLRQQICASATRGRRFSIFAACDERTDIVHSNNRNTPMEWATIAKSTIALINEADTVDEGKGDALVGGYRQPPTSVARVRFGAVRLVAAERGCARTVCEAEQCRLHLHAIRHLPSPRKTRSSGRASIGYFRTSTIPSKTASNRT